MAIIYSYPLNDDIKPLDELVGTTEKNINGQLKTVTRNFLLSDLAEFFIVDGGLQKTITLTTDGSSGVSTLDQVTGVLNIPNYSNGAPTTPSLQQVLDYNHDLIDGKNFQGTGAGNGATDANNSNFFGLNAGNEATDASSSNFIGANAGFQATDAYYSNFLGASAGYGATNANYSNFLGYQAGLEATNAAYSNFFGVYAGANATDAGGSNFIGPYAGYLATTAHDSNFIGNGAGLSATSAYTSNFLGPGAGSRATDAYQSNFIGNQSGFHATNANDSNFFGLNAGNEATNANYSNFIGPYAGYEAVDASNSNFLGYQAGLEATNAAYSNFFGVYAGANATDAAYSNFIGNSAGYQATNSNNSNFIGQSSGYLATDAYNSNFFGQGSGYQAAGAHNSNFIGNQSGSIATNAPYSNFFGPNAGFQATDAFSSNFLGLNAGSSAANANNSNFLGNNAGAGATDASYSNFLGNGAGDQATEASFSNLFGYKSGFSFTDNNIGSNNIIIGTNISLPDATANSINLGGILFGAGTYSTTSGDPSIVPTAGGRIGIGVVTPTNTLHIYSEAEDTSGLRLERLTSTSPISTGQAIGVDASGNVVTVDIPSVTGFVPYTGATANLNLGNYGFQTAAMGIGVPSQQGYIGFKTGGGVSLSNQTCQAPYGTNGMIFSFEQTGGNYNQFVLNASSLTNNNIRIYTMPDANGTLALTSDIPSGGVTSVGLSMPSAFSVSNSPITGAGTIAVTGAGVASQYVRGDGTLANFPSTTGGGASVSYYLNGSISQGTIGGVAYKEINGTPVIGTGTDFTISADGYISQFITDVGDPNKLLIPSGNWNFETYFSASSGGGSPKFYIELYKYNGTTFTLIASNSATPENITGGTSIDLYFTALAIPPTSLLVTDRLAVRFYVIHSGRTITMHTEDSHLSQIITTFSSGLTALNGLTEQVQYFATGTTGTDFNIVSSGSSHTFNLPDASATARGVVTTGSQTFAGAKTFTGATIINGNTTIPALTINADAPITGTGQTTVVLNTFEHGNANPLVVNFIETGGAIGEIVSITSSGRINCQSLAVNNETPNTIASISSANTVKSLTVADGYPTLAELKWLAGTTSSIQTQFTGKQATLVSGTNIRTVNGSTLLGSTNLSVGTVTSVTGTAPVVSSGGITPAISMAAATASVDGYLTAANFTTFNNKQDKSLSAYSVVANNTASSANATEFTFRKWDKATYGGTIAWNGTAPTTILGQSYCGQQVGNMVSINLNVVYSSAGTSNTQVTFTLPSDFPTPVSPTGFTAALDVVAYGTGMIMNATSSTAVTGARNCFLRRNAANTGYEFFLNISLGVLAKVAMLNLTYQTS